MAKNRRPRRPSPGSSDEHRGKDPKTTKPSENGDNQKGPSRGRLIAWATGISAVLGVPIVAVTFFGLFDSWWPADVQLRLTTCEQYRIVLETTNHGGRPATLGQRPAFTVRSPRRSSELRMLSYVDAEPAAADVVDPDEIVVQTYEAHTPFFNRNESANRACTITASVPVDPAGGARLQASKDCTCVFR